jgi:hypothetical protein
MKKAMSDGLRRTAKAWLIGTGLSVALMLMAGVVAPSMAEDSLEQDLGIIRACGSEVWSLCSSVLPDVGRLKACTKASFYIDIDQPASRPGRDMGPASRCVAPETRKRG